MRSETTMSVLRRKANITQQELAKAMGRAQSEVSRWETLDRLPFNILDEIIELLEAELGPLGKFGVNNVNDLMMPWDTVLLRKSIEENL